MIKELEDLIKKTVIYRYSLPDNAIGIDKSLHTTLEDHCYEAQSDADLSKIIYNSIVDYSLTDHEITKLDYENSIGYALQARIRDTETTSDAQIKKYGFFGEVLLDIILKIIYGTNAFIARGIFNDPLGKSETKGYDSYHILQKENEELELWFGETKFHQSFKKALENIFDKKKNGITADVAALSDDYLNTHVYALSNQITNRNECGNLLHEIIIEWKNNVYIKPIEYIKKYNIKLIYPMLIISDCKCEYDDYIKKVIVEANSKGKRNYSLSIPYELFFIILPVNSASNIKDEVIKWIKDKKPLM